MNPLSHHCTTLGASSYTLLEPGSQMSHSLGACAADPKLRLIEHNRGRLMAAPFKHHTTQHENISIPRSPFRRSPNSPYFYFSTAHVPLHLQGCPIKMQHKAPQSFLDAWLTVAKRGAAITHGVFSRTISGVLKFHQAEWDATSEPIIVFLNEPDATKQDHLTAAWKDTMQSQLVAVLLTVSSFPWPSASLHAW